MDQPLGHTIRLRLYPIRPLWSLGAGWAAVSGGLAAGGVPLSLTAWLSLLLVWLLADPVLGVVWDAGIGNTQHRGIWRRLLSPRLPDAGPPVRFLPYTQRGSPGYRLACHLGRLRRWWRDTLWPEAGRDFATLVAGLGLALLLGAILGRSVLALVFASILLSWLAVLSGRGDGFGDSAQQTGEGRSFVALWHALGEFGVPWLIGVLVLGGPSWSVVLLGICYAVTFFGLIDYERGFRLIGAGQATATLLVAGLRHPMAAGAMAILVMPQWGLHTWAAYVGRRRGDYPIAHRRYLRYVQPFVILSMLIAALAVGS